MKNICFVCFMIFSMLSCSKQGVKKNGKLISVSIAPQKYFIEQIAGSDFEINVLVLPGANPATYEPLASQIKKVGESIAYFKIGHIPFEKTWFTSLINNKSAITIIDLSEGLDLISGACSHSHAHEHEHSSNIGVDPHVWSSPRNVAIMAKRIYSELIILSPEKKTKYKENLNVFLGKINKLQNYADETFSNVNTKCFMIYHPALTYFARDFKLEQIPIELSGKEASPKHIKQIINLALDRNIKTILVQKQFSTSNSEAIAREINASVTVIDPLSENWLAEMNYIVTTFKNSLK